MMMTFPAIAYLTHRRPLARVRDEVSTGSASDRVSILETIKLVAETHPVASAPGTDLMRLTQPSLIGRRPGKFVESRLTNSGRLLLLLMLTLALSSPLKAFQREGWIKFASEEGGFTILMPSQPKPVEIKKEDFVFHMFTLTDRDIYLVGYGDYAPSIHLEVQSELKANRDNFLRALNAALTGSTSTELEGRPGIEFTGETEDRYFKSRVYCFGNRVYQIAVAFPKGEVDSAKIDRFFASFAFTSRPGVHTNP